MHRLRLSSAAIMLACLPLQPATAQICQLCSPADQSEAAQSELDTPLNIQITTTLDFSKAALTGNGNGQIAVDPQTGGATKSGVVSLGGYTAAGKVFLSGAPGRNIRVDLPKTVRMTSAGGGIIEIANMRTNLPSSPRLDANGQLSFTFGGELNISGKIYGKFRGRFPITAQYE
jgi:hypothetical protein